MHNGFSLELTPHSKVSSITTRQAAAYKQSEKWKIQPLPLPLSPCSSERKYMSKATFRKMARECNRGDNDSLCFSLHKMKDNQIWFDFVLHEIIWFISQSLHIHRRKQERRKNQTWNQFKCSLDSSPANIHITFHSRIDKFDYFYARAMINFPRIIWYSLNCAIAEPRRGVFFSVWQKLSMGKTKHEAKMRWQLIADSLTRKKGVPARATHKK